MHVPNGIKVKVFYGLSFHTLKIRPSVKLVNLFVLCSYFVTKKFKVVLFIFVLCSGCTNFREHLDDVVVKKTQIDSNIGNESKVMVTGALDALHTLPSATNPPVTLAKTLLTHSQELTGLPDMKDRLDVQAILATNSLALKDLEKRLKNQEKLIADRDELQAKLSAVQGRLVEMGIKYEQERNKSIVKRIWNWGIGTFGLAGTIAFIVFCPAVAIPLLGRLLALLVSVIPSVAGLVGVVSNKVLDTTIKGISNFKTSLENKGLPEVKEMLKNELRMSQDSSHVNVIKSRRSALVRPQSI